MKQKYFVFIALFTTWLQYGQEAFYTPNLNDNSYIEDTYLLTDNNEESATGVEWIDEMYEEYFEGDIEEGKILEVDEFLNFTVTLTIPEICASEVFTTVVATPAATGPFTFTWNVPAGVSNPGNVSSFSTSVAGIYQVNVGM